MKDLKSDEAFALGQTLITAKAKEVLHPQEAFASLYVHARGSSTVSTRASASGKTIRIVTDASQGITTVYHPEIGRGGPTWLTLLGPAKDNLWSLDLFQVESIHLRTHWILVVMDQFTRTIVGFGLQAGPVDGVALCRMFNQAIAGQGLPVWAAGRRCCWRAGLKMLGRTCQLAQKRRQSFMRL